MNSAILYYNMQYNTVQYIVQPNTLCVEIWEVRLGSKNAFNCSQVIVNTFLMLQNITISNKCCSFEMSIHQTTLKNVSVSTNHNSIDNIKKYLLSTK